MTDNFIAINSICHTLRALIKKKKEQFFIVAYEYSAINVAWQSANCWTAEAVMRSIWQYLWCVSEETMALASSFIVIVLILLLFNFDIFVHMCARKP